MEGESHLIAARAARVIQTHVAADLVAREELMGSPEPAAEEPAPGPKPELVVGLITEPRELCASRDLS
jgi:hypothetical protein